MSRSKWIAATAALAIGLSAGALAEDQPQRQRSDDNNARYTQPYKGEREGTWSSGYRDRGYRDYRDYRGRSYRGGDQGRDDGRRVQNRDHRNRYQDRRDRDDRR